MWLVRLVVDLLDVLQQVADRLAHLLVGPADAAQPPVVREAAAVVVPDQEELVAKGSRHLLDARTARPFQCRYVVFERPDLHGCAFFAQVVLFFIFV